MRLKNLYVTHIHKNNDVKGLQSCEKLFFV